MSKPSRVQVRANELRATARRCAYEARVAREGYPSGWRAAARLLRAEAARIERAEKARRK